MRTLILASCLMLPIAARAQPAQQPKPSSCAMFSGELARMAAGGFIENDALNARVAALTAELAAAKAAPPAPPVIEAPLTR